MCKDNFMKTKIENIKILELLAHKIAEKVNYPNNGEWYSNYSYPGISGRCGKFAGIPTRKSSVYK